MKRTILITLLATIAWADPSADHPTGNRTTPPTIHSFSPLGVARGTTTELNIEGYNLTDTRAIYFSEPGLQGRIVAIQRLPDVAEPAKLGAGGLPSTVDLGPLPPRHQVKVKLEVAPEADIGPIRFRLQTPLGTSPEGKFLIEPNYSETPDTESNNTAQNATPTDLPAILVGAISYPGDEDYFEITVDQGQELVFEEGARMLDSTLNPVISILTPDHTSVRESGNGFRGSASYFAHQFERSGKYYVRISDYGMGGSKKHFYRLKVGPIPLIVSPYPLGLRRGETTQISLSGYNLDSDKASVRGRPSPEDDSTVTFRAETSQGKSFNEVKLALGDYAEIESTGKNTSVERAQRISWPVTINGRIAAPSKSTPVANYFRFQAKKGVPLIVEVNARRLGSKLDSLIEVLDAQGRPIERATVQAVAVTHTTILEKDSSQASIRILSWNDLDVGDYFMVGAEITRVARLPRGPDEDILLDSFPPITGATLNFAGKAERLPYFDTTREHHGLGKAAYKVEIHPPGKQFTSNGLPLVRLRYLNDDGGLGYLKDSRLQFTAPKDGEYLIRIRDGQGLGGDHYAYRLTLRPPRPDFRLSVDPRNPNLPVGGKMAINVLARRIDGFAGAIKVKVDGLPQSLHAAEAIIPPGQMLTTLLLRADPDAKLEEAVPFKVKGTAEMENRERVRWANSADDLKFISLRPPADIAMSAGIQQVVLEPGGKAEITVNVKRQNGFGGRVPVSLLNLPRDVKIPDLGLNGVLIPKEEDQRTFIITASPDARPMKQRIYFSGKVETRSPLENSCASDAILLTIKSKKIGTRASGPRT